MSVAFSYFQFYTNYITLFVSVLRVVQLKWYGIVKKGTAKKWNNKALIISQFNYRKQKLFQKLISWIAKGRNKKPLLILSQEIRQAAENWLAHNITFASELLPMNDFVNVKKMHIIVLFSNNLISWYLFPFSIETNRNQFLCNVYNTDYTMLCVVWCGWI